MYKAYRYQKEFLECNYKRIFEYIRPDDFKNTINDDIQQTSDTWKLLIQESDIKDGIEYSIEDGEDCYTLWGIVQNKYKHYCKFKGKKYSPLKTDDNAFRKMKLKTLKRAHVCKSCNDLWML